MQIHEIKPKHKRKKIKRLGRGATRGTYSGRGIKGQKARAGRRMRPEMRDIIKKIHKKRGRGRNSLTSIQEKPIIINIADLNVFNDGTVISPHVLFQKKLIQKKNRLLPKVKILGKDDLTKKLYISGCVVSASAKAKIEKAGGKII